MTISVPELLVRDGFLTKTDREKIEAFAAKSEKSFLKVAISYGYISRKNYGRSMNNAGYEFQHIREQEYDEKVLKEIDLMFADAHLALPLRVENGKLVTVMADPSDQLFIDFIKLTYNLEPEIIIADDLEITWMAHKLLGGDYVKSSVFELVNRDPNSSALVTFTNVQMIFFFLLIGGFAAWAVLNFKQAMITVNIVLSLFFLLAIVFKLFLSLVGSRFELYQAVTKEELKNAHDDGMPVYTILLPVYKEDQLIKKLIWNLRSIDYPREKLDVKLLIEEDDEKTLNAVRNLDFPSVFEVIIVPFHMPKTKPKACNYGLHFAKGEYLTIYDFLTRMFTLEYSFWFDYMLPGLDTLDIPIPLGGTSNHFKMDALLELGAWDPFNVTEDADLGVRAYAKGYKVAIVNSTTYEEANNEPINWIRQRSRWIKGYMQTYLVHMRNPIRLIKRIGIRGFLGFNFFVGATPITFLVYPILLIIFLAYVIFNISSIKILFPDWVLFVCIFNLMVGNILMIYVNMMAVFKRRFYELILFAIANPIYWLLHSAAAYMGLYQLVVKPFYWEKTNHGLSKINSATNVIK
jgi:cellulose synthase/poly-beta-1,6-N-acetylglucosamine synthase-like glycosyltransferase